MKIMNWIEKWMAVLFFGIIGNVKDFSFLQFFTGIAFGFIIVNTFLMLRVAIDLYLYKIDMKEKDVSEGFVASRTEL